MTGGMDRVGNPIMGVPTPFHPETVDEILTIERRVTESSHISREVQLISEKGRGTYGDGLQNRLVQSLRGWSRTGSSYLKCGKGLGLWEIYVGLDAITSVICLGPMLIDLQVPASSGHSHLNEASFQQHSDIGLPQNKEP